MKTFPMDSRVGSRIDLGNDWSRWLPAGDTIFSSTWSSDSPTSVSFDDEDFSDTTTVVWVTADVALTEGAIITVTNRITTTAGRVWDHSFRLRVKTL